MTGSVCLTFNLDAELFWLGLDPSATDRPKTLSLGRYAITRGVDRVRKELDAQEARGTWFIPGDIAARHPQVVQRLGADGHEIGSRAWGPEALAGRSYEDQRKEIQSGIDILTDLLGDRPAGFRAPYGEVDDTTFRVLKDLEVAWSSNLRSGEAPREIVVDGAPTTLDIGARWELTDYIHFTFNFAPAYPKGQTRYASYSAVLQEWVSDAIETTQIGLPCVLTLTPDVIGKPGRALILREFLETMATNGRSFQTLSSIAQF